MNNATFKLANFSQCLRFYQNKQDTKKTYPRATIKLVFEHVFP